jgi:hypothetical protein
MKLNTQQKVLCAILFVGLVALGIDRIGFAKSHDQTTEDVDVADVADATDADQSDATLSAP